MCQHFPKGTQQHKRSAPRFPVYSITGKHRRSFGPHPSGLRDFVFENICDARVPAENTFDEHLAEIRFEKDAYESLDRAVKVDALFSDEPKHLQARLATDGRLLLAGAPFGVGIANFSFLAFERASKSFCALPQIFLQVGSGIEKPTALHVSEHVFTKCFPGRHVLTGNGLHGDCKAGRGLGREHL